MSGAGPAAETETGSGVRRARGGRVLLIGCLSLAALLCAATVALVYTRPGQRIVVGEVLRRASARLSADVAVSGIRSANLLAGVTLSGVTIAEAGRPAAFVADSIRVRYSLRSLFGGELALAGLELWNPLLTVERGPGEDESNWSRILADPREAATALNLQSGPEDEEPGLVLRDVAVFDGDVIVRVDTDAPPGRTGGVPAAGGGGFVGEQRFSRIRGRLRGAEFGAEQTALDVFALSLQGSVTEEPFELADLRGQILVGEDGLSFDAERLWLPETEMSGTGTVAWDGELRIDASLSAPVAALEDIHWLVPGLPPARGSLELGLGLRPGLTSLAFSSLDLATADGGLEGSLTLTITPDSLLLDGDLGLQELSAAAFDPWLTSPLPWRGALAGSLRFQGGPEDLEVSGDLETVATAPADATSRFEFGGRVHVGPNPGVTGFSLTSMPFQYSLLGELDEPVAIGGLGSLRIEAEGRLSDGIDFVASAAHAAAGLPQSDVTVSGTIGHGDGATFVDLSGDLQPLSFTALGAFFPSLPVTGEVTGGVSARGPLADLEVELDLETPAGPLAMNARLDARDIGRSYQAETEVRDFHLSRIVPELPEPTIVTGGVFVDGRGLQPDSVVADVRVRIASAAVGVVAVDSARSAFRLEAGAATLDTLHAVTSLGTLDASGDLGLAEGLQPGEVRIAFASESLDGLRPFFMAGPIIAADTLSRLEIELLRLEGIDPDTLPLLREVEVDGRVSAEATLRGAVDRFTAEGIVTIDGFRFRENAISRAELDVRIDGLPGTDGRLIASILTDSFAVEGRDFASAAIDLDLSRSEGRLRADLQRSAEESYQTRATYQADATSGILHLDELTTRFAGGRWNLGGPARLLWDGERFVVDDFSFTRPGVGGMRIEADGVIPRGPGSADFELVVRSLPLERLTHVARLTGLEEDNLRGVVSLDLQVSGTGDDPGMEASFQADGLGYGNVDLTRVAGDLEYLDRRITGDVEAWSQEAQVLSARGSLAAALELGRAPERFPDEPMDIAVVARAFPLAVVSRVVPGLEDVEGVVDGELRLTGPPANIRTNGGLSLAGGALALPELGVRYTDVEAVLGFTEDARATLSGSLRSGGLATVNGSLHLRPLRDPALDLAIDGTSFRAVNRYDIEGVVSGQLRLTGNYRSPIVQGDLDVEQGTLYLDEFARYQTIVDLADTTFFAAVDTTLAGVLPIIEAGQNPFLDNLVAEIALSVESDSWLRSRQIDMEIDGGLELEYDRGARRFVAVGELAAIRGSYNYFGRRFVVQEGTLEFIGIPGVNPNLDIQAVARLRAGDSPLNVIANVGGTLVAPSVSLTSDAAAPIEEPELVSYLVFGRPPALLGSGESSLLGGAIITDGLSLGLGRLADEFQEAVAQEIGFVDYFAISNQRATQRLGPNPSLLGTLASTQIEFGRYLWDDVFLSVDLAPVGTTTQTRTRIPNARLEWRFADLWGFESFAEDPLLRRGVLGVQQSGPTYAHSLGLFIYREWGR